MSQKTLILIPCCGSKNPGGLPAYDKARCIVNYLSSSAWKKLMESRKHIAIAFGEKMGPDIGVKVAESQIEYLKAYERYCGNLYSRITMSSWEKLNNSQNLSLLIISAFYGVVKHDEFIRDYNRTMNDKIERVLLKTWWRKQGLCDILLDYVTKNEVKVVHDFLSLNYSEAIQPFRDEVEKLGIGYYPHNYSGLGSGSDFYRGSDVEKLVQNFVTIKSVDYE
jgi:cytoplasmic iron level regulating protein YaaA (DUF328/UPF0246 family)